MWKERRFLACETWWHTKYPLGFKDLMNADFIKTYGSVDKCILKFDAT